MKKIILSLMISLPVACFAIDWNWIPLKSSSKISAPPIAQVLCPASIQCNFDFYDRGTGSVQCVNQSVGPWNNKSFTRQADTLGFGGEAKTLKGIIAVPFLMVLGGDYSKPSCFYKINLNSSHYRINYMHPMMEGLTTRPNLPYTFKPDNRHTNAWHREFSVSICSRKGQRLKPTDCPLLMYAPNTSKK